MPHARHRASQATAPHAVLASGPTSLGLRARIVMTLPELDAAIGQLELEMPDLKLLHRDLFAYANAWAERYDAILARAPDDLREATVQRLHRIGIRWGVAEGMRMTGQFPALDLPV